MNSQTDIQAEESNWKIPTKPAMPDPCIEVLESCLRSSTSYLEYGSGGSTMLALSLAVPNIYSVESDQAWLEGIKSAKDHAQNPYRGSHTCKWVDIGKTGDWGYPTDTKEHENYWKYPSAPWLSDQKADNPDTILIDGRFRTACFLFSMMYAKPGTTILFDDYIDRTHYHSVENYALPVKTVDRMAIFIVPERQDLSEHHIKLVLKSLQDVR